MIKLGLIDKSTFVHDSLRMLCESSRGRFDIVLNSFETRGVLQKLKTVDVDVLIMDINLPIDKGLSYCKKMREAHPNMKILVFSSYSDINLIAECFSAGANCYLEKKEGFNAITHAIKEVVEVGYCYNYDLTKILNAQKGKGPNTFTPSFSQKELTIVKLVRKEFTNKEVAEELNLHVKTVEMHKRNIIEKTNSKKILGAIDYLLINNIIPLNQY